MRNIGTIAQNATMCNVITVNMKLILMMWPLLGYVAQSQCVLGHLRVSQLFARTEIQGFGLGAT